MNPESSEKYEGSSITKKSKKDKNVNPEVLIIPPNLLEKFGFMLGGIHTLNDKAAQGGIKLNNEILNPKACNSKRNDDQPVVVNDEQKNVNKKNTHIEETSILETATLMKESVFLSPTFVPTVASVIPGELEITSASETVSNVHKTEFIPQKDIVTVPAHNTKLSIQINESKNQFDDKDVDNGHCFEKSLPVQQNLEKENIVLVNRHNTSLNSCNKVTTLLQQENNVHSEQLIEIKEFHLPTKDNFTEIVKNKATKENLDSDKKIIDYSVECEIDFVSQPIGINSGDSQIKSQGFQRNVHVEKNVYNKHEDKFNFHDDDIAIEKTHIDCVKSKGHGSTASIFSVNEENLQQAKKTVGNALIDVHSKEDEGFSENTLVTSVPFDKCPIHIKYPDTLHTTKNTSQNEEEKCSDCPQSKENHKTLGIIRVIDENLINLKSVDNLHASETIVENEMVNPEKHLQCIQSIEDQGALENILFASVLLDVKAMDNFNSTKNIDANVRLCEEKHIQSVELCEKQESPNNKLVNNCHFDGKLINSTSIEKINASSNIYKNEKEDVKYVQRIHSNKPGALDNICATSDLTEENFKNAKSQGNFHPTKTISVSQLIGDKEEHLPHTNKDQISLENRVTIIPFQGYSTNINIVDNINETINIDESDIICKEKETKLVQFNAYEEFTDSVHSNNVCDDHLINMIAVNTNSDEKSTKGNECLESILVKEDGIECKKDQYLNSKIKSEHKSQKKIKIISEEIVNYNSLPDHKLNKSLHINNLVFVTRDSLISAKAKDNDKSLVTDNVKTIQFDVLIKDHGNKLPHSLKMDSNTSNNLLKSVTAFSKKSSINCSTKMNLNRDEKSVVPHISNEYSSSNKNADSKNNTYKQKNSNGNNKKNGNTESGSKQYSSPVLSKASVIDIDGIQRHTDENQSNLRILNKKCGDNIEQIAYSTCIKTYRPKICNRANKRVITFENQSAESVTLSDDHSIPINDGTLIDTTLNNAEYYLCHDFGRLTHCDLTDTEFNQIGQSNSEFCDPNIIYEIYYDKTLLETQHFLHISANKSSEIRIANVCWNDNDNSEILSDIGIDPLPTTSIIKENLNDSDNNELLPDIDILSTTCITLKNMSLFAKSNVNDKDGPCTLANCNNFDKTDSPAQNTKHEKISVEAGKLSKNVSTIEIPIKINDNTQTIYDIPAQNSVETANNNNLSKITDVEDNNTPDASMVLLQKQYNNNSLIHKNMTYDLESLSKSEMMPKSKFTSPRKVYSCIGRGSKRNINCVDSSSYESMEKKRCTSQRQSPERPSTDLKGLELRKVKCGLCEDVLDDEEWERHLYCKHLKLNIIKSKDLQSEECQEYLNEKLRIVGILQCDFCSFRVNHVPTFVLHIENCIQKLSNKKRIVLSHQDSFKNVTCGVCKEVLDSKFWIEHIRKRHNYLAWKEEQQELNLKNEQSIIDHLQKISNKKGPLICNCGYRDKSAQLYLTHIMSCSIKNARTSPKQDDQVIKNNSIQCGVCQSYVDPKNWIDHIQQKHNYLAWKSNDIALKIDDDTEVLNHLKGIIMEHKSLVCARCGSTRKYAKSYLSHINKCKGEKEAESMNRDARLDIALECSQVVSCNIEDKDSSVNETSKDLLETDSTILDSSQLNNIETEQKDLNVHRKSKRERPKSIDGSHLTESDVMLDSSELVSSTTELNIHITPKRARLESLSSDLEDNENLLSLSEKKSVICGVCAQACLGKDWEKHIQIEHNYLAWKDGQAALDLKNEEGIRKHLYKLSKQLHGLACSKCNFRHKYVKCYLEHILECIGKDLLAFNDTVFKESNEVSAVQSSKKQSKMVKCGVCQKEIRSRWWIKHLRKTHMYLAWKDGEPHINFDDIAELNQHLNKLMDTLGELMCSKCKCIKTSVESYMDHIKTCVEKNEVINEVKPENENICEGLPNTITAKIVKCAVCNQELQELHWINHIETEHNYLAWKDGETILDLDDDEAVRLHLYALSKKLGGLVCAKCKLVRRYVKSYLEHIKKCNKSSIETSLNVSVENYTQPTEDTKDKIVNCGVCRQEMQKTLWIQHIAEKHNYMAWIEGDPVLNLGNDEEVSHHLQEILSKLGGLVCSKCDCICKRTSKFLEHIRDCNGTKPLNSGNKLQKPDKLVKCGVCGLEMKKGLWITHIEKIHNYLAWKEGKAPLNLNDEESIRNHLYNLSKKFGGINCSKCGTKRKYVKSYLEHIKHCNIQVEEVEDQDEVNLKDTIDLCVENKIIKCGVCYKEVQVSQWIKHIQVAHNYIAWRNGEKPVDLQDDYSIKKQLSAVLRVVPTLMCPYCGITKRNAEYYRDHMKVCNAQGEICEDKTTLLSKNDGMYECGMCHEKITPEEWTNHSMNKHYNVTWVVGEVPINLKNPYGVEKCLKKYVEEYGKMVCNNCGTKRASLMGFFVHVITCGKTDEETAMYKEECGICHKLYLGVYRNQHMATHKTQQLSSVRKLMKDEMSDEGNDSNIVTGRRKAAEKANQVIEKYKKNNYGKTYDFNCDNCDFGCDTKEELNCHKCNLDAEEEVEIDFDTASSSSDDYLSDVSDELVERDRKQKTMRHSLKYKPINGNPYLKSTITDFRSLHFSEECLFEEWLNPSYIAIECEDRINKYMPKLEQSCQVIMNNEQMTYSRFEGKYQKEVYSMFVGGCIQCISWAPHSIKGNTLENNYLAVVSHLESDTPRYHRDDIVQHSGLIQIWDMHNFGSVSPKFALGLVHDYGTVWAMDWCPSGTREIFDPSSEEKRPVSRLGLLAIACSNGSAYILCVPNPDSMPKSEENLFVKLKPVAELRFTMKSDNKAYQATSLSWSKKQGHSVVAVGYANGNIALFDLKNTSPLLRSSEKDLTVIYPYHDDRLLHSSISDLDMFPSRGELVSDAVCGASSVGAMAMPVLGGRRMMSRLPSSYAAFTPAWPVAIIGGDDGLVSQSPYDIEWHGCGRKLGSLRVGAGCYHCGSVLMYSPPLIRTARLYSDFDRTVVASINMKKLELKEEDESSIAEPFKYEDAITKYGVEFIVTGINFKSCSSTKDQYPERFPLADVTSLAYCPSGKYHDMAAVATHAGLIFVFKAQ